jgi:hypothetical protein
MEQDGEEGVEGEGREEGRPWTREEEARRESAGKLR